jgi:integrase
MSIRKEARQKGNVYVVRVYDPTRRSGYREKTFTLRSDAVAWEAQFNLAKRRGSLSELDAGKETLAQFINTWRTQYAALHLAPATRVQYERYIKNDIIPALGTSPLRAITTGRVAEFAAGLERGPATVRKILAVLQGVLSRAVEWGYVPVNPARGVRAPQVRRLHRVVVTPDDQVEALCERLNKRGQLLVRLLAYAGLRPGEALALTWDDVSDTAISVTKAVAFGEVKETKTGHSRLVRCDPVLRRELSSRGEGGTPLLTGPGGGAWSAAAYRNWRRRVFRPKAAALGISTRPYDLRHTFASRLFAAGEHPKYVADQMGHTLQTLLSTYVHVMDSEGEQKKLEVPRRVNASQTA